MDREMESVFSDLPLIDVKIRFHDFSDGDPPLINMQPLVFDDYDTTLADTSKEELARVWTCEYERRLLELVSIFGRKWTIVSRFLPFTPEALRSRYCRSTLTKRTCSWSKHEDAALASVLLAQTHAQPCWSLVAKALGGSRKAVSVRNRALRLGLVNSQWAWTKK